MSDDEEGGELVSYFCFIVCVNGCVRVWVCEEVRRGGHGKGVLGWCVCVCV